MGDTPTGTYSKTTKLGPADHSFNVTLSSYIKAHELQDAQDRRQIHADATLKKVLGRDQVSMFEMTKLLNQHVK